jgi:hypothetical protein
LTRHSRENGYYAIAKMLSANAFAIEETLVKPEVVNGVEKLESLEGYWRLISGFFHDRKNLFQFSEVFQDCDASLCAGVDDSAFADVSFFHEVLFYQKVQVFFEYAAVYVGFVHYVC